jgi:hypothetical protein
VAPPDGSDRKAGSGRGGWTVRIVQGEGFKPQWYRWGWNVDASVESLDVGLAGLDCLANLREELLNARSRVEGFDKGG